MTPDEIADAQLTRVIEARLERDAEMDQAFHEKLDRAPSSQAEAIRSQRDQQIAEVRGDDTRIDVKLQHALRDAVKQELEDRGIKDSGRLNDAEVREIGQAAFQASRKEYDQDISIRESFCKRIDLGFTREHKTSIIVEQNLGQRDKLTAKDVLSGARAQGLEQERRSTSARIVPSLGEVQGPPRTLSKHQLLYELSSPDTKANIEDIRQTTADARKAEFVAFKDPRVREERINAEVKKLASKPEIVNKIGGGPEQKFKSAEKLRAQATQNVHAAHRTAIANTYADEQRGIREALDNDPNNQARFRSMDQPLDPRTNSKEAREIAVARVEERREKQRELTRKFNRENNPLER